MVDKQHIDTLCEAIIAACIEVHKQLGHGLLEPVYHAVLAIEFTERKIPFVSEYPVHVSYKGKELGLGLRADFPNQCQQDALDRRHAPLVPTQNIVISMPLFYSFTPCHHAV